MPVAGDGLVAPGGFGAALGDVGRPVHGEIAGEQEDLLFVAAQPAAQRVAGVVPLVPVPQPVVDDAEGGGLVVALRSSSSRSAPGAVLPRARASWTAWCASRKIAMISPAQDCRPPGPSLVTARHRLMMC